MGTLRGMSKPAIDFTSPTWHAVQALAAQKVAQLREQNDSPTLDAIATASKRGRIAAWNMGWKKATKKALNERLFAKPEA